MRNQEYEEQVRESQKYLINELIDIYAKFSLEIDESYENFIYEIQEVNSYEDELVVRDSLIEYDNEIYNLI